jgi:type I restriction enzyme, S subunit
MSSAWPMVPLGEVLTLTSEPHKVFADQDYPNFGIYSFGRGLFKKPPISGSASSAKTLFRVKAGQFIYSRLFAFEGAYGLVSTEFDGCFVSNEYPTFEIERKKLEPAFLTIYFQRKRIWEEASALASGMGDRRRRIQPESFLRYKLPLPPLGEQRRLIECVQTLAAKLQEAELLRKSIHDVFPLLSSACARRSLTPQTKITIKPLRDLTEIRGGGTPSKANPFFWNGLIPWVSPKDMKVREIYDAQDHITDDAIKNSSAQLLPPGAVLVVVRGMILAHTVPAAVLQVPAAINQDMKAMIVTGEILPAYLCALIWANNGELLSLVEKSTHDTRKLETAKLLDFAIPVPPLPEQRRLILRLSEMQQRSNSALALQNRIQVELDAMLPAVLDLAFRGEL